jgi:hypothetical protein
VGSVEPKRVPICRFADPYEMADVAFVADVADVAFEIRKK